MRGRWQMSAPIEEYFCHWTKLESPCLCTVKSIYWHGVVGKESAAFIVMCCTKNWGQLVLKKSELPDGFQGKIFKEEWGREVVGCMISLWTFSGLAGGETHGNSHHQPSSSDPSGGPCACGQHTIPLPGGGLSICKTAQRTWLRIWFIALEEEPKVLEFV